MSWPRFNCGEDEYNDVATLFLSSQHHTIIKLFSVGHDSAEGMEDEKYRPAFSVGGLALFTTSYLGLMSIGAGLAIPGGLFMPSILVSASAPTCMAMSELYQHRCTYQYTLRGRLCLLSASVHA